MKKFAVLIIFLLLLSLLGCEKTETPSEPVPEVPSSESEGEAEPEEPSEPELFEVSIAPDVNFADASLEIISENYSPILLSPEDVIMSEEYQIMYDKYVKPISNAMPLRHEFSENKAPDIIYTYIFYQTRWLDENVLDIHSDYDPIGGEGDSQWLNGRAIEESIARWFPWNPKDYRQYFEYDSESDRYYAVACGGGPSFSYLTGYEETEDGRLLLSYSFYNDDMSGSQKVFKVYFSGILEVKLEEKGWKYLSNTETFSCEHGTWHNEDYSFDVTTAEWHPKELGVYEIFSKPFIGKLSVPGILNHSVNVESQACFFPSYKGIWVFNGNKFNLDLISFLPSNENITHIVSEVKFDDEGNVIIIYTPFVEITEDCSVESLKEQCGTIKLAVFKLSEPENIKFIDTKIYPYVFKDGLDVFHIDARSQEIKNGKIYFYMHESEYSKGIEY